MHIYIICGTFSKQAAPKFMSRWEGNRPPLPTPTNTIRYKPKRAASGSKCDAQGMDAPTTWYLDATIKVLSKATPRFYHSSISPW